jgi:hypothetical protein
MKSLFILLILFLSTLLMSAQFEYYRYDEIEVLEDGVAMPNPWAGGLNSPQVSRVDLNGDGALDLFIFDRVGNRVLTFINTNSSSGAISYKHTFEYNHLFPALKSWALMRDFNCDGKSDLFTNATNGMKVYKNNGSSQPEFDLENSLLQASYNISGTPFNASLYCVSVDIPSINDFDGDGDLDIFVFTELASTVYYYKNLSVENYGTCDSLEYIAANRCYGKFREASESADVIWGADFECDFNMINPEFHDENDNRHGAMHTGGIILQIDLDQDGIKDMIISDVNDEGMRTLMMGECPDGLDSVINVMENFPSQFISAPAVDLRSFPAGYYEDVNNDGIMDLLAAPNSTVDANVSESLWLYLNEGENDLPEFVFQQENFLQDGMIELGWGAYPVAVDWNNDGLMDLVVANKEYNNAVGEYPSQLALFENTGTNTEPQFTLLDLNWLNIPQYAVESIYPSFGDLDNDGDLDMILGEEEGKMHYFKNNAGAGQPMDLTLQIASMTYFDGSSMDVGQFATPQLIDLNGDDLLDLLVGEKNGNINYIENVGTSEVFSFEHMIDTIGDVVATNFLGINGYSVPFMYKDADGVFQLMVGSETGDVNHYDNVEGNFDAAFNLVNVRLGDIWEGTRSAITMYDFDADDTLDVVLGQVGGGIAFYKGGQIVLGTDGLEPPLSFNIFPNPATDQLTLDLGPIKEDGVVRIINLLGQEIDQISTRGASQLTLDISSYNSGVYLVQLVSGSSRGTARFIKQTR